MMDEEISCIATNNYQAQFFSHTLPKVQPLLAVASPVEYLKRFQLSLDFFSVRNYLRCLVSGTNFLELYKHYFPEEYARSEAPLTIDTRSALSGGGDGYGAFSAREVEFFHLVNVKLFPIDIDSILTQSWEGDRPDLIPLEYYGHGFDIDEPNYENYRLGWQLLAYIFSDFGVYTDFDHLSQDNAELTPYAKILEKLNCDDADEINRNLLSDLCQAEDAPPELEYLPMAIRVLDHTTQNLFIDPDDMYPVYDAVWSDGRETLDALHEHHVEAHQIMADCDILLDWIEADPKNFRKVIDVCNRSNSKKQPKKSRQHRRSGPSPVEHRVRVTV